MTLTSATKIDKKALDKALGNLSKKFVVQTVKANKGDTGEKGKKGAKGAKGDGVVYNVEMTGVV